LHHAGDRPLDQFFLSRVRFSRRRGKRELQALGHEDRDGRRYPRLISHLVPVRERGDCRARQLRSAIHAKYRAIARASSWLPRHWGSRKSLTHSGDGAPNHFDRTFDRPSSVILGLLYQCGAKIH
jgi:hypothetical protein